MLRFLRAGLVAGSLQALIVSGVTVAIVAWLGINHFTQNEVAGATGASVVGASIELAWVDVMIALCIAFLRTRSVRLTAASLRIGFRKIKPTDPEDAANTLLVPLFLTAAGCALLAVREPPRSLLGIGLLLGNAGYGLVAWPAIMSVGVAAFGANAHAALLAKT